jgi:hypothetical protein
MYRKARRQRDEDCPDGHLRQLRSGQRHKLQRQKAAATVPETAMSSHSRVAAAL